MSLTRALRRFGGWVVVTALISWFNTSVAYGPHTENPDGALNRAVTEDTPQLPVPLQGTRYQPVRTQTGSSATLILQSQDLHEGDEIGVWNQAGAVVGVGFVEEPGKVAVTVWGDDIITESVVDGAQPGETLRLTAWLSQTEAEHNIEVLVLTNVLTGQTVEPEVRYEENGVHAAEVSVAGTTVGTEDEPGLPATFELGQNYPNPFNPTTTIRYALPEASQVQLGVYDVMGRRVAQLFSGRRSAGRYEATWDGRNSAGQAVSSGVYFYRLEAGAFTQTHRMVLLK